MRLASEQQVAGDVERLAQRDLLPDDGYALPLGGPQAACQRHAAECDRAGTRGKVAGDAAHDCRLTGPRFTAERDDLAGLHAQVDVLECDDGPEADA